MSIMIILILFKRLWVIIRGCQCINRFSRGKRNGSWEQIRGIPGYFVREVTMINGNGRKNQIWGTRIKFINCPIVLFYHSNGLFLALL